MNIRFTHSRLALAVALASGVAGSQAIAQAPVLEEVLVTAQKREQSLQDTPLAVSAFDAAAIDNLRIRDVEDVSIFAPNVEIVETPASATGATIAIRGASQINPAITWENSVGLYLDGVFIGKNLGGIFDITELERVEVLRGPQGTLYGKNTVGGAVNLITRKPSGELGGKVRVEAGNEDLWATYLSVDTPTVAGFKATVSGFWRERDGFYDNTAATTSTGFETTGPNAAPSTDDFNNQDAQGGRLALLWDASETFEAFYAYDTVEQDLNPKFAQLTQVSSNSTLSAPPFVGQSLYLTDPDERADKGSNDFAKYEKSDSEGHALQLTWDVRGLTFKSITSYRELKWDDAIDIDGTPMDIFHSERHVDYDQTSQEFQLLGSTETLNYVAGLYYFEEQGDVLNPITFFGVFGIPTANNEYGLDNKAVAAFGQVDWVPSLAALQKRLTLTFGVRWTQEEKDQYVIHPGIYQAQADEKWTDVSPTFTAAWQFNDNVSGYFRMAEGWKSGGFNGEAATQADFEDDYEPEEVLSYELGAKSRLWQDRIQLNAAVFRNDIDDFQLSVFEGANALSKVVNIPEFQTQGFELEFIGLLTPDLRVTASYGYLDAEYKKFPSSFTFFTESEAGVPYAPENSAALGVDWTICQSRMGILELHVDWSYLDEYTPYIDPDQVETSTIESRELVNARLSLAEIAVGGDNQLTVALWGKNLLDEEYRTNTLPFGGRDQRVNPNGGSGVGWTTSYFGDPRTYGIEASLAF